MVTVGGLVYGDGVTRGRLAVLRAGTPVNAASVAGKVERVADGEAAIATGCPLGAHETNPKTPKSMAKPKQRHEIFMPFVPEYLQTIVWLPYWRLAPVRRRQSYHGLSPTLMGGLYPTTLC